MLTFCLLAPSPLLSISTSFLQLPSIFLYASLTGWLALGHQVQDLKVFLLTLLPFSSVPSLPIRAPKLTNEVRYLTKEEVLPVDLSSVYFLPSTLGVPACPLSADPLKFATWLVHCHPKVPDKERMKDWFFDGSTTRRQTRCSAASFSAYLARNEAFLSVDARWTSLHSFAATVVTLPWTSPTAWCARLSPAKRRLKGYREFKKFWHLIHCILGGFAGIQLKPSVPNFERVGNKLSNGAVFIFLWQHCATMETKRREIATLICTNHTTSFITRRLDVSKSMVYGVRKRLSDGDGIEDKPHTGWPKKLNPEVARKAFKADPTMNVSSPRTTMCVLPQSPTLSGPLGGKSKRHIERPLLTQRQWQVRLEHCQCLLNDLKQSGDRVIFFSDEKTFTVDPICNKTKWLCCVLWKWGPWCPLHLQDKAFGLCNDAEDCGIDRPEDATYLV